MPQKKKLTAEEREKVRIAREEKARSDKESALRRQKVLHTEKKLNLYDYMAELTGCPDLSIARLKDLFDCEYIVKNGETGEEQSLRICDLIADAADFIRRGSPDA